MTNKLYALLRQEGNDTGTGTLTTQVDFDVEKVKASGLFVEKTEIDKLQSTWSKKVKAAEENSYKLLGTKFDEISTELETLTGIQRNEIENDGKKEREKLTDYVKRIVATKQTEPLEKERQLREVFGKKEQTYKAEIESYQKQLLSLQYSNE
ncbi:MAG: hypothetical protein ACKO8L_10185, partial [Flavobacterium sp.]